jgi:hypothetical protein
MPPGNRRTGTAESNRRRKGLEEPLNKLRRICRLG